MAKVLQEIIKFFDRGEISLIALAQSEIGEFGKPKNSLQFGVFCVSLYAFIFPEAEFPESICLRLKN